MKPTLRNGDIWSEGLSNSSIRPYVATDLATDEPGSIAPLLDSQLSSSPSQIKTQFYDWNKRVLITAGAGRILNYTGADILTSWGLVAGIPDGQIVVDDNATRYVWIDDNPAVAQGPSLPNVCVPLAKVTTVAGAITALEDLRYQHLEQVRPVSLPAQQTPVLVGMILMTARQTPDTGWMFCQGQNLSRENYPELFNAIGAAYGGSGNFFNLPDLRDRVAVGAGARARGSSGGQENIQLNVSQMPSHSHGVNDSGHAHGIYDPGHAHAVADPGHAHGVNDPGHEHNLNYKRSTTTSENITQGGAELSQANGNRPLAFSNPASTGVSVRSAQSNIGIQPQPTGIGIVQAQSNISIQAQGGNAPVSVMQPFSVLNYQIRVSP